ncbi:hypothetical protein ZIOFF_007166 [Zingiber officinale]|uniref:Uncharacterized protein n=1 Tax=Zingiber officinale TaxID=94328 RepID=A0A8J5IFP4_ZINOF|nr:hypothetical protein ZIOFF_007166 [Zingiber officinale]
MGVRRSYTVTIRTAETIAPVETRPEHRLQMSNLDLLLPPVDFGVFFCYEKPMRSLEEMVAVLRTGLKCGGLVVACKFDHRVADAYSANMFLVFWSEIATFGHATLLPSFCRTLLSPRLPLPSFCRTLPRRWCRMGVMHGGRGDGGMGPGDMAERVSGGCGRALVDWVEAHRPEPAVARIYLVEAEGGLACVVSSGRAFPVKEVEFGWGKPAFGSYHFPWDGTGTSSGYVMPMPSARGNGDWSVYEHLQKSVVAVFEAEQPPAFRPLTRDYYLIDIN